MRKLAALLWCAAVAALAPSVHAQVPDAANKLIEPGRAKGSISVPSFSRILAEQPASVHLIDVSSAREFAAGSIKGATNVPINQIEKRVEHLPADRPIVFFCSTGGRASEAYDTVKLLRPELAAYFLDAQVQIRPDGTPNIR